MGPGLLRCGLRTYGPADLWAAGLPKAGLGNRRTAGPGKPATAGPPACPGLGAAVAAGLRRCGRARGCGGAGVRNRWVRNRGKRGGAGVRACGKVLGLLWGSAGVSPLVLRSVRVRAGGAGG
ncbi:hypothetical protein GCM10010411_16460 [Actinomadura fulvescens]|uniref:Uncharacterized protein n=1 Tax=Actinomadura fulvescens TaxID=46160 RepID=A0ABN3PL85_9ACTN